MKKRIDEGGQCFYENVDDTREYGTSLKMSQWYDFFVDFLILKGNSMIKIWARVWKAVNNLIKI